MLDNARFLADISIPDDSNLDVNQPFVKTWLVENSGETRWGEGYTLVYVGGDLVPEQFSVPLPPAKPGKRVEISVALTTPMQAGQFYCNWRFQNADGDLFGDLLYCRIYVSISAESPRDAEDILEAAMRSVERNEYRRRRRNRSEPPEEGAPADDLDADEWDRQRPSERRPDPSPVKGMVVSEPDDFDDDWLDEAREGSPAMATPDDDEDWVMGSGDIGPAETGRFEETRRDMVASPPPDSDDEFDWLMDLNEEERVEPVRGYQELMQGEDSEADPGAAQMDETPAVSHRYVNAHLARPSLTFPPPLIDPAGGRLTVGRRYLLIVNIGQKQGRIVGHQPIPDDYLLAEEPETSPGIQLTVGVTGLDFEVKGTAVQPLWFPRDPTLHSSVCLFTVVPQTNGVARLRFCIYRDNDLIQSFRLAALTTAGATTGDLSLEDRQLLAAALDLPLAEIDHVSYLTRLEYSITQDLVKAEQRRPRLLSIVANHHDDQPVITIKNTDGIHIRTNGDLPAAVQRIRNTLQQISYTPVDGYPENEWPYTYGVGGTRNRGTVELLQAHLPRLADCGWDLFDALIDSQFRDQLSADLNNSQGILHIAHILLDKVIPWALVYDQKYDPRMDYDDEDHRVAQGVCLAGLPDADGNWTAQPCGQNPDCLLHAGKNQARKDAGEPIYHPESVVCPRHFWGFKYMLELPPQQTVNNTAHDHQTCILAQSSLQVAGAFNGRLRLGQTHFETLQETFAALPSPPDWALAEKRHRILRNLKKADLDVIYFYCHARSPADDPEAPDPLAPPYLEFHAADQAKPKQIEASDISSAAPWQHHPLVFLNGCRTAGFSPRALSPFITKFVVDCQAAGFIGTEIAVFEQLATEMAELFLSFFLKGNSAGESLLRARRGLLAQHNPLGLVYTLYADAELAIDLDGDGKC